MFLQISPNLQEDICAEISFLVFSCEFCEICNNTFFAEQQRTTASDYCNIKVTKGVLGNETVDYDAKTKAYLLIWARSY